MLESFTVETFSGHLGEAFRMYPDASNPLEVELISATGLAPGGSIPCARSSRPSSTWLGAAAPGGFFPTTSPRGRPSTTTSASGT